MSPSLIDFSHELADTVDRAGQSIISVLDGGRTGVSGTIWRKGIAIVVAHTINGLDEVNVVLPSGVETKVKVSARDSGTDIAMLEMPEDLAPSSFADDSKARAGEIVLSIGRRGTDGLAAAFGIVSAISGAWRTSTGARVDRWIRLDLNPFAGFSGGAVVNAAGEVIGMATSGSGRSAEVVPASTVNRILDQLIKHGHPVRGYIGVGLQPVGFPEGAWQPLGITSGRGLLITAIAPGSPAEQAKLTLGDVIVKIDGKPLSSLIGLHWLLDSEMVGKSISLGVVRAGELLDVSVSVLERPAN
jgi:S1-C subfamily serine protease